MDAAAEKISPSLCGQGTAAFAAAAAAAYVNEMSSLLLLRSEAEKISSLIRQSPQKEGGKWHQTAVSASVPSWTWHP